MSKHRIINEVFDSTIGLPMSVFGVSACNPKDRESHRQKVQCKYTARCSSDVASSVLPADCMNESDAEQDGHSKHFLHLILLLLTTNCAKWSLIPIFKEKSIVTGHIVQAIWAVVRIDLFLNAERTLHFLALLTVQKIMDGVGSLALTAIEYTGRRVAKEKCFKLLTPMKHFSPASFAQS